MLIFFFFNDTATTEIYTLSLHDALPISEHGLDMGDRGLGHDAVAEIEDEGPFRKRGEDVVHGRIERPAARDQRHRVEIALQDRKSTRLNSSHANISYAVFCLKKKKI